MSLKRTLDMPEAKAFGDFVASSAAEVSAWPEWKRNAATVAIRGRPDVQEVQRTEADMRADAEETLSRSWEPKAKRHARDVLALLERLSVREPKAEG